MQKETPVGKKNDQCNKLKSMDIFGENVEFTFKKETRFKTWIGASISAFTCTFVFIFLTLRTLKLVN